MSEPVSGDMATNFATALEAGFAADASPASSPTPESTPAATSPAAAIAQPVEQPQEAVTASTDGEAKGEPPKWRWQDILENARKEHDKLGYERAKTEYEQRLQGVQPFTDLSPQERDGLLIWNRALRGDPVALQQVAQVNPSLAAAISGRPEKPSAPDPEPQPDAAIQMPDGSQVPVFTPQGMKAWQEWNQKHLATTLESQFTEKFKPLMTTAQKLQQLEEDARVREQSTQWANQVTAPLSKLPYYDEFKPELLKALTALPETATDSQMTSALYDTYASLHTAKVNGLTKDGETKALALQQQRAVASAPNPAAPNASTPRKFKPNAEGFAEALAHFSGAEAR